MTRIEPRFLTHDEVERLADAAGEDGDVIRLLAYTGLRFGEMAALRVRRVDFLRRRLTIAEAVTEVGGRLEFGTPKTHQQRTVPLPATPAESLARHCEGKQGDDHRAWLDRTVESASVEELGPTALVVRGGSNRDVEDLVTRIERAAPKGVGPVLSVSCGEALPGETFDNTLRRVCEVAGFPHPKVQVARLAWVQSTGVTLASDSSDGQAVNHYHAWFNMPVEKLQVQDFIDCFDGPIPNPTGGKKRGGR